MNKILVIFFLFFLGTNLYANPFLGEWEIRKPFYYLEGELSFSGGQRYLFKEDGIVEITTKSFATGKESWMALRYELSGEWITIGSSLYWYMLLPDNDILLFHIDDDSVIKNSSYGGIIEITDIRFLIQKERSEQYPLFIDER